MSNDSLQIPFNFCSIKFTPKATYRDKKNSISILKECCNYIFDQKHQGKGYLVDRHKKKGLLPRELFISKLYFDHRDRRYYGVLSLIRSGKKPMLKPKDQFTLIPIDAQGDIAESTRFVIDISGDRPIACIEFNNHGPRIYDIEFYFRSIAHSVLRISRKTEFVIFQEGSLEDAINNLKEVLSFEVKMKTKNLSEIDANIKGNDLLVGVNNLSNFVKPEYIKLKASFIEAGTGKIVGNRTKINGKVRNILKSIYDKPFNSEGFENFELKYINSKGENEDFSLLKSKKEVIIEIKKSMKTKEVFSLIDSEINKFIEELVKQ